MNQKCYSTDSLKKASDIIQKHLSQNHLNFIYVNEAQNVLDNNKIQDIDLNEYFKSLNINTRDSTLIFGAKYYYLNRWIIFNSNNSNVKLTECQQLLDFFNHRIEKGLNSFRFSSFFILIIIIIGLIGSFLGSIEAFTKAPILQNYNFCEILNSFDSIEFNKSIIGYSIVLICSSAGDYLYPTLDKSEEDRFKNLIPSLRMVGLLVILTSILLAFTSYIISVSFIKVLISMFLAIGAMIFWFIGNSRVGTLIDDLESNKILEQKDFSGGDTKVPLKGSIPNDFNF